MMKLMVWVVFFVKRIWSGAEAVALFMFLFLAGCSRSSSNEEDIEDAWLPRSDERLPEVADFYYNDWLQND